MLNEERKDGLSPSKLKEFKEKGLDKKLYMYIKSNTSLGLTREQKSGVVNYLKSRFGDTTNINKDKIKDVNNEYKKIAGTIRNAIFDNYLYNGFNGADLKKYIDPILFEICRKSRTDKTRRQKIDKEEVRKSMPVIDLERNAFFGRHDEDKKMKNEYSIVDDINIFVGDVVEHVSKLHPDFSEEKILQEAKRIINNSINESIVYSDKFKSKIFNEDVINAISYLSESKEDFINHKKEFFIDVIKEFKKTILEAFNC